MKEIFNSSKCLSQGQIQGYLNGKLTDDDRYQIENHLLDCPLCTDAVEGFATHYNFQEDKELKEVEQNISEVVYKESVVEERTAKRISINRFNRIAAAAMIVLLPMAAFFYWQSNQEKDFFQAYYEPLKEEPLLALRSTGSTTAALNVDLKKAFELYQEKKYIESTPFFEKYFSGKPEDANAAFFAGMAYLESGQNEKAIEYLSIARFNDSKHFEDANWYLALVYLKSNQSENAKQLLEDLLKNEGGFYYKQAREIYDSITIE